MSHVLVLAFAMFSLGLGGALARRSLLVVLLSVELMLNAGGLVLVAGAVRHGEADGMVMFVFVLAVAATEVAVAVALAIRHERLTGHVDIARLGLVVPREDELE